MQACVNVGAAVRGRSVDALPLSCLLRPRYEVKVQPGKPYCLKSILSQSQPVTLKKKRNIIRML